MPPPVREQLTHGVAAGLVVGALACSVALLGYSVLRAAPDCARLSETECSFEESVQRQQAAMQRLGASGLGLIGAGGLFWLRSHAKDRKAT